MANYYLFNFFFKQQDMAAITSTGKSSLAEYGKARLESQFLLTKGVGEELDEKFLAEEIYSQKSFLRSFMFKLIFFIASRN